MVALALSASHVENTAYVPVIRRERDAELANRLANDPVVHRVIAKDGKPIDCTPAVRNCVILSNGEDAVMIFEMIGNERSWLVMTIFGPTCRGRKALATGRAMRDFMMPKWADRIFGPIPDDNPAARWFYRQLGGSLTDTVSIDGKPIMASVPGEKLFLLEAA